MKTQDEGKKPNTRRHRKHGRLLSDVSSSGNQIKRKDKLMQITESLSRRGLDFTTIEKGGGYKIVFPDGSSSEGRNDVLGYKYGWINKKVLGDVSMRVEKGLYVPKNKDNDRHKVNSVLFNVSNIEKFLGVKDDIVAIDINACYITTLNKIGALSDEVFNSIISKYNGEKEYKVAMSSAVGSLGATDIVRKYKGGVLNLNDMEIRRREYNVVRLDVIDRVWEVAKEIVRVVPDSFFMFLTDCFFVHKDYEEVVGEILRNYGYQYKREFAYFKNLELKAVYELAKVYQLTFVKESNIVKKAEDKRDTEDSVMSFSSRNCVGYLDS